MKTLKAAKEADEAEQAAMAKSWEAAVARRQAKRKAPDADATESSTKRRK